MKKTALSVLYVFSIVLAIGVTFSQGPREEICHVEGAVPDCNDKTIKLDCQELFPYPGCTGWALMGLDDPRVKNNAFKVGYISFCIATPCRTTSDDMVGAFVHPPDCNEK